MGSQYSGVIFPSMISPSCSAIQNGEHGKFLQVGLTLSVGGGTAQKQEAPNYARVPNILMILLL